MNIHNLAEKDRISSSRFLIPAMRRTQRTLSPDLTSMRNSVTNVVAASMGRDKWKNFSKMRIFAQSPRSASPASLDTSSPSPPTFASSSSNFFDAVASATPSPPPVEPVSKRLKSPTPPPALTTVTPVAAPKPVTPIQILPPAALPEVFAPPPPMSDFLSRESELLGDEFSTPVSGRLGDLGDFDLDRAASAFPDISLDGSGDIPSAISPSVPPSQTFSGFPSLDELSGPAPPSREVRVTEDDEIDRFENQFPDIDVGPAQAPPPIIPQQPSFGALPPFAPRPQPSAFTPILQQSFEEEEPEVIRAWREKQAADIKKRDEESAARREETIAKAKRDIDQFYDDYNTKKTRNIKENKQEEAEFLATFSESLTAGTTWSRICDYVDLQNSQSKTLARAGPNTTDLTRFKEVLLRLKREGEAAPGAAGY